MVDLRKFILTAIQPLAKASFCCICDDVMLPPCEVAIVRFSEESDDWKKAHPSCALFHPQLIVDESLRDLGNTTADVHHAVFIDSGGRGKHTLTVDGQPVFTFSDLRHAEGASILLAKFPKAVAGLAA